MKKRIKLLSVFIVFSSLLIFPNLAGAVTTVNLFQITNDGSQQKDALIYKDIVAYDSLSDIWAYNIDSQTNYPLIQKDGEQYATSLYKNLIIYDNLNIGSSVYQVRMFDINTNKDILIAGGIVSHSGGVTNGQYVVYLDNSACGPIHSYNIKKKTDVIISAGGCQPLRIYNEIVIWPNGASGGTNIYGYNLEKHRFFDVVNDPGYQESPNIFENKVVYLDYIAGPTYGDYNAIKTKDLKTGLEKIIYQSSTTTLQWPAISNRYVVWSESSAQHINGIKAADLKTGEVLEVQPQGPHQNSHTMPSIWGDTAAWMSFRSGNGDIYGAKFNR